MIDQDKFGNPIYPTTFRKLKVNEKVLLENGYIESKTKPNMFERITPEVKFYADMRGTYEVPIWKDTRPLFYYFEDAAVVNGKIHVPGWKIRRLFAEEFTRLSRAGCPCRLSDEWEDDDGISFELDEASGIITVLDDGYCLMCGKDFGDEGGFCSKGCEERYNDGLKEPCEACGKKIESGKEIFHHVSYFPERTILVHKSCCARIHRSGDFPDLKPSEAGAKKFYAKGDRKNLDKFLT